MNEPAPERLTIDSRPSIGKQLTTTRKARGWTVGYVANQLRLPEATIVLLEGDDYAQLPEVYAKGYLRNYARLLRLPADEILQGYAEHPGTPAPSRSSLRARPEVSARPSHTRAVQAAAVGKKQAPSRTRPAPSSESNTALYWIALVLVLAASLTWWWPDQTVPLADWAARIRSLVAQPPAPPMAETVDPDVAATEAGTPSPTAEPAPAVDAVPDRVAGTGTPEPSPAPPAEAAGIQPATGASSGTPAPSAVAGDTLILRFTGDSWATVIDADGKRLMHDTGLTGTSRTLKGKAPFHLTIGRVADVLMEFNGQSIVFPNAKNRATERFSIPMNAGE